MEKYIVTRHFRCTKQEDEQITKRAANENKSTSAYLRDAALNRAVPIFDERIAKILRDTLENELRIGTNINQAVRLCNSKSAVSRSDYDPATQLGPVVSAKHKESVCNWIAKGIEEGAELVLDGRDIVVPGYENGYFVGPTIFDHVTPEMTIGNREIFGPVTLIKRVKDFEEGIALMNANPFANGSVIFTQSGYYAREFEMRTDGGMVGVNVGIPVPTGYFPFSGNKESFFGDQHVLGLDGVRFYTRAKTVTKHWYDEESHKKAMDTWEGTVER